MSLDVPLPPRRQRGRRRPETKDWNDGRIDGNQRNETVPIRGHGPAQVRPADVARSGAPHRRPRLLDAADARLPPAAARTWPTLAIAATLADLRVGTWVYASPLRPAWTTAWEAHSLSVLTEGRFEMGIGAGRPGIEDELRARGMPAAPPSERLAQVREVVTTLQDLDGPDLHTPVVMAVRGPKAKALAAEVADTATFALMPGDDRAEITQVVRDFRPTRDVELSQHVAVIGDAVAPHMALPDTDPAALRATDSLAVLPDDPAAAAEEIQLRREEIGFSYFVFGAVAADTLAPVVAELTGR
jgi:alkanesulfonate monooxygenase SsuD/methylene tetrahydromethanopterin reductase-like flavin-dependent oxidoreductase (luciferase family)